MCGIVAVYNRPASPVDHGILVSMRDVMWHRGPDDSGIFVDGHVGLGHRRLSIIDLSAGGHQPMSDETGRVWITFNGEIYNFLTLREELAARGYRFRSRSDTEVILALYCLQGDDFVGRLNGIFAFALWDSRTRRLYLIRDRMGVKPLYVWRGRRTIAAASEVKALLAHPEVTREFRPELVPEYLAFRQLAGNQTLVKGIEQVGAGQMVVIGEAGERTTTYWSPPLGASARAGGRSVARSVEELDRQLCEATSRQMIADVPLGTFNSGGVDSSLITSYVAERVHGPVNSFAVGFEDSALDERPYAEVVARAYHTRHRTVVVDDREYANLLPAVVWHHDEPLSHPHTVQLYVLSRLTRQFVKVVLTGEGSDELFAGYPRYRAGVALELLGDKGARWGGRVAGLWPSALRGRLEKAKRALLLGPSGIVIEAARWVADADLQPMLTVHESPVRPERQLAAPGSGDLLERMLAQDQRNYLQALLMRLDKVTMASSLEARVPFLDNQTVDFAATIPSSQKIHGWQTKFLVKCVAERRLPKELIHRRKMGFAVPLRTWFRNPAGMGRYVDMLLEPRSLQRPYLERVSVRRLLEQWRRGHEGNVDLLWGLVNLELWHREVLECHPRTLDTVGIAVHGSQRSTPLQDSRDRTQDANPVYRCSTEPARRRRVRGGSEKF